MRKGYVTVFFTATLTICMSLFLVMIYSVRENALRMRIKETADISIKSSVAEYQRTLWDRYGLIFTDAGYGNKAVSMILTEERLKECMNRNFDELPDVPLFGKDLLKLKCDSCEAENVRFATDYGGAPLIKQAADYMEHRYGIEYVTGLYELAAQCNDYEFSALSLKEKLESATDKLKGVKNAPEIKEWTDRLENAVIGEGPASPSVLLPLVMEEVSKLSGKRIKKEACLSQRDKNLGNWPKQSVSPSDSLLFREYLIEKCGDYLNPAEDTALSYEVEYLIGGESSDRENLSAVVLRLLLVREAANFTAIYNDPSKMETIRAVASLIALFLLSPDIIEPLSMVIVLVWAYAESLKDVRVLLAGGKIPIVKTGSDFYTNVLGTGTEVGVSEHGMSYKDYLRAFLLLESDKELAERFADIVELNVRIADDNKYFRMDFCFDAWAATAYVDSEYGYDYVVKRMIDTEVN